MIFSRAHYTTCSKASSQSWYAIHISQIKQAISYAGSNVIYGTPQSFLETEGTISSYPPTEIDGWSHRLSQKGRRLFVKTNAQYGQNAGPKLSPLDWIL